VKTITENFKLFENWLQENWVDGFNILNQGATDKDIQNIKDALSMDLPKDLEEMLRCHNGQEGSGFLFDGFTFLTSEQIIHHWNDLEQPDWIAVAEKDDTYIGITSSGKIEYYENIYQEEDEDIEAESLTLWFDKFTNNIFKNNYILEEEFGTIEISYNN
jgi:cell wall assembly regulator SMI1